MRIGLGLSIPELATRGGKFSPASLFTGGTVGAWYDPSDYSTLFQDSAGTTPVTAVEQPVGLMLDKSQGLVLGSELVTNGDFSSGTTGWTKGADWTIASGAATLNTTTINQTLYQTFSGIAAGKVYSVSLTVTSITSGSLQIGIGTVTVADCKTITAAGTYQFVLRCGALADFFRIVNLTGGTTIATVDNISVKEIAGNHASQSTTTSRPVLRSRYNQLTYSEDLTNAAWSPFQATKNNASQFTADSGGGVGFVFVSQSFTSFGAVAQVFDVEFKYSNKQWVWIEPSGLASKNIRAWFDIQNGVVGSKTIDVTSSSITSVGSGWYRCRIVFTGDAADLSGAMRLAMSDADNSTNCSRDGTSTVLVRNSDFRFGTSIGTYQRIAAATDYATAGFLPYLATDGSDDFLTSGNINLTGTSRVSAFVGATKNNDSYVYAIVDFGASGSGTAGGFSMWAGSPTSGGSPVWASSFQSSAGGTINIVSPTNFAAPATAVLTAILDTVNAGSYLRVNGALQTTSAVDPTDGTFGNIPLRLSRTGPNGLPGRIYSVVIVGKLASASEISATEAYVNSKTGAY